MLTKNKTIALLIIAGVAAAILALVSSNIHQPSTKTIQEDSTQPSSTSVATKNQIVVTENCKIEDIPCYPNIKLVGYSEPAFGWQNNRHSGATVPNQVGNQVSYAAGQPYHQTVQPISNVQCVECQGSPQLAPRMMMGVDGNVCDTGREPRWKDGKMIPWETYAYGEYIGPYRTPHVPEYRIRVNDQLEFVFMLTREKTPYEYRFGVGDVISLLSPVHVEYNQNRVEILSDGSCSLALIGRVIAAGKTLTTLEQEINERYMEAGVRRPQIVIQGVQTNMRLQDLRDAVDARAGVGGQSRSATVGPDGTIQLPMIHSVPAIGLTLKELAREVNERYKQQIDGIEVTPILVQRAPRVAYVLGEVGQPGRIDLVGPTSVLQAISLAQGWNVGGNIRQVVIFRRDKNWNLMATRLDLAGALHGRRPHPADEIWLRDGDIVLVPKTPILRLADAIDLYVTRTIYALFPNQGFSLNFGEQSNIIN